MMKKIFWITFTILILNNASVQGASNDNLDNDLLGLNGRELRAFLRMKKSVLKTGLLPSARMMSKETLEKADEKANAYIANGRIEDFTEAVRIFKKLAPQQPIISFKVGALYGFKYQKEWNEVDLITALEYASQLDKKDAVSFQDLDKDYYYSIFGAYLQMGYARTGKTNYFDKSLQYLTCAQEDSRPDVLFNKGSLYLSRYNFHGNFQDLEESIAFLQHAVDAPNPSSEMFLALSRALQNKYFTSTLADEEHKKLLKRITTALEKGKDSYKFQEDKAIFLTKKYNKTHSEDDYNNAFGAIRPFFQDKCKGHPENIGCIFLIKYAHMIEMGTVREECDMYFNKASKFLKNDHSMLGILYAIRFDGFRESEDLRKAKENLEKEEGFSDSYNANDSLAALYLHEYKSSKNIEDARKVILQCKKMLDGQSAFGVQKTSAQVRMIHIFLEGQKLGHTNKLKLFFQDIIPYIKALNMRDPEHQFLKARLLMLLENQPYQEILSLLESAAEKVPGARLFLKNLQETLDLETVDADRGVEDLEQILDQGLSDMNLEKITPTLEKLIHPADTSDSSVEGVIEDEFMINFTSPASISFSADKKTDQLTANIKKLREYKRNQDKSKSTLQGEVKLEDRETIDAKDFMVNKKSLLDKLFSIKSDFNESDLYNLLNHEFCKSELELKQTKSGVLVGSSISTHHNHGQSYKGLHRKFLKALKDKISTLLFKQGITNYY